jgi:hypothetical protein
MYFQCSIMLLVVFLIARLCVNVKVIWHFLTGFEYSFKRSNPRNRAQFKVEVAVCEDTIATSREFAVDAFELANIVIDGLFAVIALGFTISSTYPIVVANDSTVTRLIGLNYVALSIGLIIAVVFYRYNLPKRWFGFCVGCCGVTVIPYGITINVMPCSRPRS